MRRPSKRQRLRRECRWLMVLLTVLGPWILMEYYRNANTLWIAPIDDNSKKRVNDSQEGGLEKKQEMHSGNDENNNNNNVIQKRSPPPPQHAATTSFSPMAEVAKVVSPRDDRPPSNQETAVGHPHAVATENDDRLCQRADLRKGQWSKPDVRDQPPPYRAAMSWERSCYDDGSRNQQYYHRSWIPHNSSCHLTEWKAELFCERLLEGMVLTEREQTSNHDKSNGDVTNSPPSVTLLFIGDSIALQQMHSLQYLLADTGLERHRNAAYESVRVCPHGRVLLLFSRSNYLGPDTLRRRLQKWKPDLIVANRGIHYTADDELLEQLGKSLRVLRSWQRNQKQRRRPQPESDDGDHSDNNVPLLAGTLIWRTTVPGHPDCQAISNSGGGAQLPPIDHNNATAMEEWVAHSPWYQQDSERLSFHWDLIRAQNDVVEQRVVKIVADTYFLDAYDWNLLRPDFHIGTAGKSNKNNHQDAPPKEDCLHYCLPGVPDETNRILLHVLGLARRDRLRELETRKINDASV